jgi:hypothetical protein
MPYIDASKIKAEPGKFIGAKDLVSDEKPFSFELGTGGVGEIELTEDMPFIGPKQIVSGIGRSVYELGAFIPRAVGDIAAASAGRSGAFEGHPGAEPSPPEESERMRLHFEEMWQGAIDRGKEATFGEDLGAQWVEEGLTLPFAAIGYLPRKAGEFVFEKTGDPLWAKTAEYGLLGMLFKGIHSGARQLRGKYVPRDVIDKTIPGGPQGRVITNFKEFWRPLSTIPESKVFMESRYKDLFGGMARVERIVGKMRKRFEDVPMNVKQDVFNAIRGELPIENLPIETQKYARQVRSDLNRVGKMLVKRGLLKEETFLNNKDSYIHYMYLRHVLPEEISSNLGTAGKLNLSYLKARKDLTYMQRRELGLIEDVSVAAPVGMGKALGDIVKYDFYEKIARNPEWTWKDSFIPTGEFTQSGNPKFITIGKLVDETNAYRQMVEKGATDPYIIARLRNYESMLEESAKIVEKVPEDFASVPNDYVYGPLAGAFVRKQIWDDIRPMAHIAPDAGKLVQLAQKGFEGGMTVFKVGKVAVNPPTMFRNTVSNFIQWDLGGVGFHRIPSILVSGVESFAKKDKYYREIERHGGFQTNWSVAELGEVMKIFDEAKSGKVHDVFRAIHKVSKYYGKIDDISKMALYKDARIRQGMKPAEAAAFAQKWAMDYSLANRGVKYARRYALPFATYQYKIAPLIAESLVKRPWVFAKYAAIPTVLAYWAKDNFDWSNEDLKEVQSMMAERTKTQGSYTLLPVKDEKGNIHIVNLEYYFPWGNYLRAYKNLKTGEGLFKTFDDMFGVGGPYGSVITMMKTLKTGEPPKDPFTGRDIYSALDTPAVKYQKWVEWWWQVFGPSAFSSFGALGTTKRAITGEKDRWGNITSPAEGFAKWFGFNIGTLREEQVMASRLYRIKKLEANFRRIMLDPKYSDKERESAKIELQKQIQDILTGN